MCFVIIIRKNNFCAFHVYNVVVLNLFYFISSQLCTTANVGELCSAIDILSGHNYIGSVSNGI